MMLDIKTFGGRPDDASDTTFAVRAALRQLHDSPGDGLSFAPGRYDFWPDHATEQYLFISNNDEGLKRIAFPLASREHLVIDGRGAHFVFHGTMCPFLLQSCNGIVLKNFSIDWDRTFHSEAQVRQVHTEAGVQTAVDAFIPDEFGYRISYGRIIFTGEGKQIFGIGNILEFDSQRRETAYLAHDHYSALPQLRAQEIGPRLVRFTLPFRPTQQVGNVLVFQNEKRDCPAITIDRSSDVRIENVTINHCGGMGVIAQFSSDIALSKVQVTPRPNSERVVSITADAIHFVNCGGTLTMTDCLFENQLDDATNVHGIYTRIKQRIDDKTIEVELRHHQQWGIDIAEPGDRVELVRNDTLQTYHTAQVVAVDRLNKQHSRLSFDQPLPVDVRTGDCVNSLRWQPNVVIRNCIVRRNRARGLLISTAGKVLIEENTFHTAGAAVQIAGDANYWFESGVVNDVTICGNTFDNCLYGVWGRATIDIEPVVLPDHRPSNRFHRNVLIEGNQFIAFDPRLVRAECVDGLTVRDNQVRWTREYAPAPSSAPHKQQVPIAVVHCSRVQIQEPMVSEPSELSPISPLNIATEPVVS